MDELSYLNVLANKIILNCCDNVNENFIDSRLNGFIENIKIILNIRHEELNHLQPTIEEVNMFVKLIENKFDDFRITTLSEINELLDILKVEKNKDDLMKRVMFMNDRINKITNNDDIYVYLLDGHGRTLLSLLSIITKNRTNKIHIIIPEIHYSTQLWHQYLFKYISVHNIFIHTPYCSIYDSFTQYVLRDNMNIDLSKDETITIIDEPLQTNNIIVYFNYCSVDDDGLLQILNYATKYKENFMFSIDTSNHMSMKLLKMLFIDENYNDFLIYFKTLRKLTNKDLNKTLISQSIYNTIIHNFQILKHYVPLTNRQPFMTFIYHNNCCCKNNIFHNIIDTRFNISNCNINMDFILPEFKELVNDKLTNISLLYYCYLIIEFLKDKKVKTIKSMIEQHNEIYKKFKNHSLLSIFVLNNIFAAKCWR